MAGKGIPELLNYKQKGKDLNEFIKVPVSEKLAYCFGDPALTLMYTMTTTLLIYFYTNVVGISAGAVGMIMLLSRIFDGFSDHHGHLYHSLPGKKEPCRIPVGTAFHPSSGFLLSAWNFGFCGRAFLSDYYDHF